MAVIRYIAIGRKVPAVQISFSRNGGKSWQEHNLVSGQTFHIPPDCANLLVDRVPYSPIGSYEIRDCKVANV